MLKKIALFDEIDKAIIINKLKQKYLGKESRLLKLLLIFIKSSCKMDIVKRGDKNAILYNSTNI